jgi:spoIIIJ-associated protein
LVAELLGHMGLSCRVASPVLEEDGTRLRLQVSGEDAALVIGRQGQTLDAIELVVNRMVDRQWPGSLQITLDAEGYRDRRAQKLIDVAYQEASKVRRSGRAIELEPMSPRDRRSVHLALQDEPGVSTRSEGEGAYRHIIIEPARPLGLAGSRPRPR